MKTNQSIYMERFDFERYCEKKGQDVITIKYLRSRFVSLFDICLMFVIAVVMCSPVQAQVFAETEIRDPAGEFPPNSLLKYPTFFHAAPLGDLDGDGNPDIVISDGANEEVISRFVGEDADGAVWIAFMEPGARFARHRRAIKAGDLGISTPFVFGHAVAALGDLDGDGNTDIAVSAWSDGRLGTSAGGDVYVLFLNDDGSVHRVTLLTAPPWSGRWGRTMTFMGDLDGDGAVELAVTVDPDAPGEGARVVLVSINSLGYTYRAKEITEQIEAYHDYEADWTYLANAGDINGDGVDDLVSGDIMDQDFGAGTGSFYVIFLDADGDVLNVVKQRNIEDFFSGGDGDAFGYAIAPLGDIDGDGVPDLIVGAPLDDAECRDRGPFGICRYSPKDTGAVWLLAMNRDGTVKAHRKWTVFILDSYEGHGRPKLGWVMGYGLGNLGDLSGDGRNEISIANGSDEALLITFDSYSLTSWGYGRYAELRHLASSYRFGAAIEPLGEMNTGLAAYPVVAAGTPLDDEGAISGGAVFLTYLAYNPSDETVSVAHAHKLVPGIKGFVGPELQEPGTPRPPCRSRAGNPVWKGGDSSERRFGNSMRGRLPMCPQDDLREGDRFGEGLAQIGDLDGNGVRDLVVGAPGNGGALWILRLEEDGRAHLQRRLDRFTPGLRGVATPNSEFGYALEYLGDMDGDGTYELAVGAPGKEAVYVLSLNVAGDVVRVRKIADGEGGLPAGTLQARSRFGHALAAADVTGDGRQELLVGAPLFDDATVKGAGLTNDVGVVYALPMTEGAQVVGPIYSISRYNGMLAAFGADAPARGDRFGWSIAGLNDFGGNAADDLIVGAWGSFGGNGAAYLLQLDPGAQLTYGFMIAEGRGGLQGPLVDPQYDRIITTDVVAHFGAAVAPLVLHRDGLLELVVGAEGMNSSRFNEGALWILRTQLPADEHLTQDPISDNPDDVSEEAGLITSDLPEEYFLGTNYPNPFNPQTIIRYGLPESTLVRLEVFDVLGRRVNVLVNDIQEAGWHEVNFDGQNLPSGAYLYRLQTESFTKTNNMLLLK